MKDKIEKLLSHLVELEVELGSPDVLSDQKKYRELTKEHFYLSSVRQVWGDLSAAKQELEDNRGLLVDESDPEFLKMLEDEIKNLESSVSELKLQLERLLVPPDPDDDRNTIVELRAGTGGDEAAIFVGDCVRMYKYFADKHKWLVEELSCTPSERGGYKEYVMAISGASVYRFMRYEGGTHRVQRVPDTETQGRVHTSAITVAVLLEPAEEEDFVLEEKDLRVDTYRASGSGGQHVNTTDSAVRVTHIPTNLVAYCSEEKSQHKNKDKALRLLKAKIVEAERQRTAAAEAKERSMQVGSGDRSGRIRTYNFSQNRISDHRINYTRFNLDAVMNGELEDVTESLVAYYYHKKLMANE